MKRHRDTVLNATNIISMSAIYVTFLETQGLGRGKYTMAGVGEKNRHRKVQGEDANNDSCRELLQIWEFYRFSYLF